VLEEVTQKMLLPAPCLLPGMSFRHDDV